MNKKFLIINMRSILMIVFAVVFALVFAGPAMAQGSLEGRINQTIIDLVRIINILIVGFVAWAGFLIAKGDGSGVHRLIYGIVGLIVVNTAYLIINYFR